MKLTALRRGKIRRVIINMPPRHLKSHLAPVAPRAWCLGHEPGTQILCVIPGFKRRNSPGTSPRGSPANSGRHPVTPLELPRDFDRVVQSWDTANKATEPPPSLALPRIRGEGREGCTTWGIAGKDLYLLDLVRRRMEYPELKRELHAQYERFRPSVVLIEDKASGTQLIQELVAEGLHAATRYRR
jgi:hypothetical protein